LAETVEAEVLMIEISPVTVSPVTTPSTLLTVPNGRASL